jgi:hypothetical protein
MPLRRQRVAQEVRAAAHADLVLEHLRRTAPITTFTCASATPPRPAAEKQELRSTR